MIRGAREERCRAGELRERCRTLIEGGGRMQMAWAWFPRPDAAEVCYLAAPAAREDFVVWRCTADEPLPSLAHVAPLLGWYEREITDLFGIAFEGHPEPHPLVLHEGAAGPVPPLHPDFPAGGALSYRPRPPRVPEIPGPDVQELPFGPVRADVVESAQFLFFYLGEHILHYQPRLFFKHRGMEKRFEGVRADLGVVLAERVSAVGGVAHALAYCQALEAAAGCEVPPRARALRVLLAELERLYNHLHYFGHLADTTTLKVGNAEGKLLEERVKQINARLTGSRFLRNLIGPGGLRRDIAPWAGLGGELGSLQGQIRDYLAQLDRTTSYLDRLITTGALPRRVAFDQGATGPVERASGLDRDLRRDHPYAGYAGMPPPVPVREEGDADARARVRAAEIDTTIALLQDVLARMPEGGVRAPCAPGARAEGLGWSESPRGSLFYAVHCDEAGRLARVKIKSPSFSNWRVFPFTVHDSNMMDYAINEASFGLTVAGCDR